MCLSVKEKRVITSPGTLSLPNKRLYKYRLRKRLEKIENDLAFLHDHRQELSKLGISLKKSLPTFYLDADTQASIQTDVRVYVNTRKSDNKSTSSDIDQNTETKPKKSYLLD